MMKTILLAAAMFAALTFSNGVQAASDNPNGNADHGKQIFVNYGCYQCHGYEGQGGSAGARIGPNPLPFPSFVAYVRHPKGLMPPFTEKLIKNEQDLADIWVFLKARKPAVSVDSLVGK